MNTAPDLIPSALKMLATLCFLLGGMSVVYYLAKRLSKKDAGGTQDALVKVLANHYIGFKKHITLVEIPGSILVLGVSNDNIRLLAKIDDLAFVEKIRQETSHTTPSFSEYLSRVMTKFKLEKK
jgi:flagellar biogenesis protein FliO